ncbi:hypothetical protein D3C85_1082640 [compost metagenome]
MRIQAPDRLCGDAQDDDQQGGGEAPVGFEREQQGQGAQAQANAHRVPEAKLGDEFEAAAQDVIVRWLHPQNMRQLPGDDDQGQAEGEAAQHRLGNERGDASQAGKPRQQEEASGEQHQTGGQGQLEAGIPGRQGDGGGGQHRRRGRGGRDDGEAAATHQSVADEPRQQGDHPVLRRQTRDARIGDRLGHQQPGHGQPRQQVWQPGDGGGADVGGHRAVIA